MVSDRLTTRAYDDPSARRDLGVIGAWLALFVEFEHGLDEGQRLMVSEAAKRLDQVSYELREVEHQ